MRWWGAAIRLPTVWRPDAGDRADPGAGGEGTCNALAHQVTTLDKSKIVEQAIGRLSEARMKELDPALANYLRLT